MQFKEVEEARSAKLGLQGFFFHANPLKIEFAKPNSALFEMGKSKVIAAVYGPREVRPHTISKTVADSEGWYDVRAVDDMMSQICVSHEEEHISFCLHCF